METWIKSINPLNKNGEGYDNIGAFKKNGAVDYRFPIGCNIKKGEQVYIYMTKSEGEKNESSIIGKSIVIMDNVDEKDLLPDQEFTKEPQEELDKKEKYMRLKIVSFFPEEIKRELTLKKLQDAGLPKQSIIRYGRLGSAYDYVKRVEESSSLDNEIEEVQKLEEALSNLNETEREQVIKARIGQGQFKKELMEMSPKCKICGLKYKELLIASHIKPWKHSSNKERKDVFNGFLLCPSHDALFDKGYITFDSNGKIVISEYINEESLSLMNISKEIKIELHENNKEYLKWHRTKIFR